MKIDKRMEQGFKEDLNSLLKKYDAQLVPMFSGDIWGIYDEGVGVSFRSPKQESGRCRWWSDTVRLTESSDF